jgi:hypothetical protein
VSDELLAKIERLEAQVAALTDERLPRVDRASRHRDRRQVLGGFGMFVVALLMAGTLSASALAGSNTVTSDDIVDNGIYHTDIRDSNVTSADVKNNSLTGADVDESTLTMPKILTAKVNYDGSVSSGNAIGSHTSPGLYTVTFPRSVAECTAVASTATQWSPTTMIQTSTSGAQVTLTIRNDASAPTDRPFSLIVACP